MDVDQVAAHDCRSANLDAIPAEDPEATPPVTTPGGPRRPPHTRWPKTTSAGTSRQQVQQYYRSNTTETTDSLSVGVIEDRRPREKKSAGCNDVNCNARFAPRFAEPAASGTYSVDRTRQWPGWVRTSKTTRRGAAPRSRSRSL